MTVELVTGFSGTEHVTSGQDGARQAGTVGTGKYVLMTNDDPLAATLENANTVTVGPGDVLINGRHVQLTGSTTFSIPVGTQAQQTSNLLVIRYSRDDSGVEKAEALTLTGEPAASDPQDPATNDGNILDGDTPVDMVLYRVITTGIETAQPVKLFSTITPLIELPGASGEPLPIADGGTGIKVDPSLLVNLSSTTADNVFKASPRPGVSGTLPLASGGTGSTSASGVRTNIGLGKTLWTGSFKSGSIIVPGLSDYDIVGVYFSAGSTDSGGEVLAIMSRSYDGRRFLGGMVSSSQTDMRLVSGQFNVSGNTLTYVQSCFAILGEIGVQKFQYMRGAYKIIGIA